ncbi:MAG: aminomethyltransferase family protein [Chitinivibrionales bacterium]|nr:aminomethyltransferase family protein [Chitinivibrionales bacterium]
MRTLPLSATLQRHDCRFTERFGCQVIATASDYATEYWHVRNSVGLTDCSYVKRFRLTGSQGLERLDTWCAGPVSRTRFGRVTHTFCATHEGALFADCYVANNDDEYFFLCEALGDDDAVDRYLQSAPGTGDRGVLQDITADTVCIGIDGPKAWMAVKRLLGADVVGLPYLSVENYGYRTDKLLLFRAGKTSEFGYLLLAPVTLGRELFEELLGIVNELSGGLCGSTVHDNLRLEGRFFNIYAEGKTVGDPLELGLQWMIDFGKPEFTGREALLQRRSRGLSRKIVGFTCHGREPHLDVGCAIYHEGKQVATVAATGYSPSMSSTIGLASFVIDYAYAGCPFFLDKEESKKVTTISMPPITPKSLLIKLDEQ